MEENPGPWFTINCSKKVRADDGSCLLTARCRDSVCALELFSPEAVDDDYLSRLQAVMEESATEQDVDRLLEIYAPDAAYEHPRFGMRIDSLDRIRAGMVAFLGKTRRPGIRVLHRTRGADVIVLELEIAFEALSEDGWNPTTRVQVTTLELKDGRIRRVIDYW